MGKLKRVLKAVETAKKERISGWHGSPHDFDEFSDDAIGTGEGAQAYGHGHYIAEGRAVAEGYRDDLSGLHNVWPELPDGKRLPAHWVRRVQDGDYVNVEREINERIFNEKLGYGENDLPHKTKEVINGLEQTKKDLARVRDGERVRRGRLYQVEIDASPDELLDWDKPLYEQPRAVDALGARAEVDRYMEIQKQLDQMVLDDLEGASNLDSPEWTELVKESGEIRSRLGFAPTASGDDVYRQIGHNQFAAKQKLQDAGIKGIRYKDGFSRGSEGGTSNYVIFDPKLIEIAKKYSVSIPVAAGIASGMTPEEAEASFAGRLAKGANLRALDIAERMEAKGKSPERIWKDTGWFQGADGKWRFEVDDSQRSYTPRMDANPKDVEFAEQRLSEARAIKADFVETNKPLLTDPNTPKDVRDNIKARYIELAQKEREADYALDKLSKNGQPNLLVGGALDAESLRQYPEIGDMRFQHSDMPYTSRGSFDPNEGIEINKGYPMDKQESTMLHEVQHGIQDREGFARGGSPDSSLPTAEQLTLNINSKADADRRAIQSSEEYKAFTEKWIDGVDPADWPISRINGEPKRAMLYPQARMLADQEFGVNDIEDVRRRAIEDVLSDTQLMESMNTDRYPAYKRLAGEVEARNVQTRQDFTPDERRASPPWTTEDVPRDQQIVRHDGSQQRALSNLHAYERGQKIDKVKDNLRRFFSAGAAGTVGTANLLANVGATYGEDVVAGLAGIGGSLLSNDWNEGARQVESVREAIPDVPLSDSALAVARLFATGASKAPEPVKQFAGDFFSTPQYLGNKTLSITGSPGAAAVVEGVLGSAY